MKKALVFLVIVFLFIGVFGEVYYFKNRNTENETNVSVNENDMYPEDLRPVDSLSESESSGNTEAVESMSEEDQVEEDLEPDENFSDFEIEEDTEDTEPEDTETDDTNPEIIEPETEEGEPENAENTEEVSGDLVEIINSRCNVRKEPSREGKILGTFYIGDEGILLEEGEDWSIIRVDDLEGYVSNKFWKYK